MLQTFFKKGTNEKETQMTINFQYSDFQAVYCFSGGLILGIEKKLPICFNRSFPRCIISFNC